MPGERTEQATQHRREQARKEGDILHSRELSAAAGTLAGVLVLGALAPGAGRLARQLQRLPRPWASRPLGTSQLQPTLSAVRSCP